MENIQEAGIEVSSTEEHMGGIVKLIVAKP